MRRAFPAMRREVNGHPLVYLDSASTAQKPRVVIDAVARALELTANVHRGVHTLSAETTVAFEEVRTRIATLLGARDRREIVFVRGATEALNLVAQTWGRANVGPGDEILVTELEHHANLVPWQMLADARGATLVAAPIDERGDVDLNRLAALLGDRTRVIAVAHVSNSLGTVVPVAEIVELARANAKRAVVVVDGAQAVPHRPVDVAALGCDFYAFSGHKMYGPTGAGALWGRRELLDAMPPWQGGGEMILSVALEGSTWNDVPHKFEAGTPDVLGVLGLGAAIDWLEAIGLARIEAHEARLVEHAIGALADIRGLRLVGAPERRAAVVSFDVEGIHPHDLGTALDLDGVLVRSGHHCAQPALRRFGLDASVRASFGVYSTDADVDALVASIGRAQRLLTKGQETR